MNEDNDFMNVPESSTVPKKQMRFSVVWIIPLIAAIVAVGIAVQRIMTEGPTISVIFKKAEGIEAGKTFVKYKDVDIGQVTKVKLANDFRKVVVTAKIDKSATGLLVDDARLWIEQPRATLSGISGIGTLLSGNYIGLEPGKSDKQRREFTGLDVPPPVTFDEPGRRYVLKTPGLGSLGNGSPIYYRQLNVGRVIGYDLEGDGGSVSIEVFVRAPYDKYVTDQTRFWQASGIDASVGAEGISVRTQSLLSMVIGGIVFETPTLAVNRKPSAEKTVFALFNSREEALVNPETLVTNYVLYFNETLRGLSVGAPVMSLGLPTGEVTAISLEYNPENHSVRPRVDIAVYPRRFLERVKKSPGMETKVESMIGRHAFIQQAVERGLRAQLRSGSLLTGQRFVALDIFPDAPAVKMDWRKSPAELPVVPSGMQDLETKISSILNKMERMPLDDIGTDLEKLLVTLEGLVKRIDRETMTEVKTTIEDLRRLLAGIDAAIVDTDAPTQQQLRDALQEFTRAARGISALTEYLERNPEALIRGKKQEKP